MRPRAARVLPAVASMLAAGLAVGGCTAATANTRAASARVASSATAAARVSAPFYGPPGPDPACADALKAEQILQAGQGKDQGDESALDQDFTNFANALSAAAQKETNPARAKAMTALANDYNALVESQSGAAQLPDMSTVENDGTAFSKACSLGRLRGVFTGPRPCLTGPPGWRPGQHVPLSGGTGRAVDRERRG
jgi:hypothetical protein